MATERQTLRDRIYEQLVEMIVSGELPAGSALDERALLARLKVSRTPFREAVAILAKEGLASVEPYRGFYVRSLSRREVNDLYELRRTLECMAIRLAIDNISNAHIDRLQVVLDSGIAALKAGDMSSYANYDLEFHESIAKLSGNEALVDVLQRLSLQIQMCRVLANQTPDFAERAAEERDDILHALRARDADRASALMDAHIADVQRAVMKRLEEIHGPANDDAGRIDRIRPRSISS